MATCILYHGPGAQRQALEKANLIGRLSAPPFGEEGLSVKDARQMVSLLQSPLVGGAVGVVVAGPMDITKSIKASDVLLKAIEEFDETVAWPILWADDLGTATLTIRSRCRAVWCPPVGEEEDDDELMAAGFDLVEASLKGEVYRIPGIVQRFGPNKKEKTKGRYKELLNAAVDALATTTDPASMELWERVRPVTLHWRPTGFEIIAVFLPDAP